MGVQSKTRTPSWKSVTDNNHNNYCSMQRQATRTFNVWNTSYFKPKKYVTQRQKGAESERDIEELEYKQHKNRAFLIVWEELWRLLNYCILWSFSPYPGAGWWFLKELPVLAERNQCRQQDDLKKTHTNALFNVYMNIRIFYVLKNMRLINKEDDCVNYNSHSYKYMLQFGGSL